MKELLKKLAKVKTEIGKISKDKTNPFFKSKYFDINSLLEHVEPLLEKNELLLIQPIKSGKVQTVIFDLDSEAFEYSEIDLPDISDPQKLGSAITYYRRYTLQSLLGLQAEDDDGNTAAKAVQAVSQSDGKDDDKKWSNPGDASWIKAVKKGMSLDELRKFYKVGKENGEKYLQEITKNVE
jgi:hypothetical protein